MVETISPRRCTFSPLACDTSRRVPFCELQLYFRRRLRIALAVDIVHAAIDKSTHTHTAESARHSLTPFPQHTYRSRAHHMHNVHLPRHNRWRPMSRDAVPCRIAGACGSSRSGPSCRLSWFLKSSPARAQTLGPLTFIVGELFLKYTVKPAAPMMNPIAKVAMEMPATAPAEVQPSQSPSPAVIA